MDPPTPRTGAPRGGSRLRSSLLNAGSMAGQSMAQTPGGTPNPEAASERRSSQRSAGGDDEDVLSLSPPFTQGVTDALYHLRVGIEEVSALDDQLAETLRDIVHDLATEFEGQIMMMFDNWDVAESRRRELLRKEKIAKDPAEKLRRQAQTERDAAGSQPKKLQQQFDLQAELEADLKRTEALQAATPVQAPARGRGRMHRSVPERAGAHGVDIKTRELRRCMSSTLSVVLHALAARVQAQRGALYIYDRTTSTIRSVCTTPDPSSKQVIIPSHTGAAGSVFTSAVAFNIGGVDEYMQSICKVTDQLTGHQTKNLLAFPVLGGCTRQPLGVIELTNKAGGSRKWTEEDEFVAYNTAALVHQILSQYPYETFHELDPKCAQVIQHATESDVGSADGHSGLDLDAAAEQLGAEPGDHRRLDHGAMHQNFRAQLVFRADTHAGKLPDASKVAGVGAPVVNSTNLKEVHSYLTNLEESYRSGLNQYVTVEKEKSALQEELQRKVQRIRVLDENVVYLDNQLRMCKSKKEAGRALEQPGSDPHDSNARNFQGESAENKGESAAVDEHGFSPMDQLANRQLQRHRTESFRAQPAPPTGTNQNAVDFDFPGLNPVSYPNTIALVQRMAQSPPPALAGSQAITTSVPTSSGALPSLGSTGRRSSRKIDTLKQIKRHRLGGGFSEASRASSKSPAPQSISADKYRLKGGAGAARTARAS